MEDCPACGRKLSDSPRTNGRYYEVMCERCGNFGWSSKLVAKQYWRPQLSGWIREQNDIGSDPPRIDRGNIDEIAAIKIPSMADRARLVLTLASERSDGWSTTTIRLDDEPMIARIYGRSAVDLDRLCRWNVDLGFMEELRLKNNGSRTTGYRLTTGGIIKSEELARPNALSDKAFVGIWYSQELEEISTTGFERAIRLAGYRPSIIRQIDHAKDINDIIVSELRQSRFAVCDLTGGRPNVYFEVGYAMGMNIPAILTCKKDDGGNNSFNLRQFNCIDWANAEDLCQQLVRRIERVVGHGPVLAS